MKNQLKQNLQHLGFTLLALLLLLTSSPAVTANAKTTKTAKTYSVAAKTNYKKAPALKVNRKYHVTAKKNNGITKFTAPSKGVYKIAISSINTLGVKQNSSDNSNLGNFRVSELQGGTSYPYLSSRKVKTQGGSTYTLYTATSYSYKKFYASKKVTTDTYLKSRYAKLSLKKGETVYLQYYFTGKKCRYNLKVSKVTKKK